MNDLRHKLLKAGVFQLDGWTSWRSRDEACRMRDDGLLLIEERGSDEQQYTYWHCSVTDAGRTAIAKLENGAVPDEGGHWAEARCAPSHEKPQS